MRLFPRWFQDRYGDEAVDMLAGSDQPIRDAIDMVFSAVRLRLDERARLKDLGRHRRA